MSRPPGNSPLIMLAAGGTGGHVFPAEALAAQLAQRGCRLVLVTDRRGDELSGRLGELETFKVRAGGIAGKGFAARIFSVIEILLGTWQAWWLINRMKPTVVVGFGGDASVPTMLAASYAKTKAAIHEQNAVLGRANCLLAGRVQKIATSFAKVAAIPESAAKNVIQTGMPVRPAVAAIGGQAYPALTADSEIQILVLGGSQGASVFSRVMSEALALVSESLKKRIKITQQCRLEDEEGVRQAYRQLGVKAELSHFFKDVHERIAGAHLLICRSGASTIAEITTIGRPAILVPYPHAVDDHQTNNAHSVDEAGGGWLLSETAFTPESLAQRLNDLFAIPRTLENAAAAAKRAGNPDAAERLADMGFSLMPSNGDTDGNFGAGSKSDDQREAA